MSTPRGTFKNRGDRIRTSDVLRTGSQLVFAELCPPWQRITRSPAEALDHISWVGRINSALRIDFHNLPTIVPSIVVVFEPECLSFGGIFLGDPANLFADTMFAHLVELTLAIDDTFGHDFSPNDNQE